MTIPYGTIALAAALALLAGSASAESGRFEMMAATTQTLNTVQLAEMTVVGAYGTGALNILQGGNEPFTTGSSATVKCVRISKKTPTSFDLEADCVATFSPSDSVALIFKRHTGDVVGGSSGEGTEEITAGTGKFAGVSGSCTYRVTVLASDGGWNIVHSACRWQR